MKCKSITYLFGVLLFITLFTPMNAKEYKGAELRTHATFTYGRFEVRLKPANRPGMLSSFFTYHEISNISEWNEIDIEILGRYDDNIQFNTITGGQMNHVSARNVDLNPFEDFHTYAIEWTPEYIAWFIDGEEVYRQTEEHVSTVNRPQKMMMNIWNPVYTDWVGEWKDEFLPAFAYYDWVSYSSYTSEGGNTGTDSSFTFEWKDEFNSYDSDRWGKGTHTWQGNQSDFVPENVVFKDGYMILCLTAEGETGYQDNRPPAVVWTRETYENEVIIKFSEEVESSSAETASNYIIPGVEITNALLSDDKTKVRLSTTGYQPDITYNVIVQNILDDAEAPNELSTSAKTISQIDTLEYPVKINVGGNAVADYIADQPFGPGVDYGYMDGDVSTIPGNTSIDNTDTQQIFRTQRYGLVTYKIRVPNGRYRVKLQFAETYYDNAGERSFDVSIENEDVVNDLDVFSQTGKNSAYEVEHDVDVNDETIDIYLPSEVDYNILNGIVVNQISTGVQRINNQMPNDFKVYQNYPNPFNGETTIKFKINSPQNIKLKIFNVLGENIYTKSAGKHSAGVHEMSWDASTALGSYANSGIYFYQIIANNKVSITKKLVYLK